jgi:hypothetical protein
LNVVRTRSVNLRFVAHLVGSLTFVVTLVACGTTIVTTDSSVSSTEVAGGGDGAAGTTLPSNTASQLTELVALATSIGDLIADGDPDAQLARIDALWAAARGDVESNEPSLGREFVHQLELLHTGVDKNRPADADKAARNLDAVAHTFVERHPA